MEQERSRSNAEASREIGEKQGKSRGAAGDKQKRSAKAPVGKVTTEVGVEQRWSRKEAVEKH